MEVIRHPQLILFNLNSLYRRATGTTTVDYAGLTQADGAYTLMTALKSVPAAQNTLAEPAWQAGTTGPVTLILGTDFTGVDTAAGAAQQTTGRTGATGKRGTRTGSDTPAVSTSGAGGGPASVQSRNAGASICSGLPPAYTAGG